MAWGSRRTFWLVLVAMSTAGAREAVAAGFAIREQSTTALGNAFAGATSGADDLSYMFFNPAALAQLDGYQVQTSLAWASPHVRLHDASGTTAVGTPIAGSTSAGDIAQDVLIPSGYLMAPLGDRVRVGLGVNSPFGLKTDYSDDWVGRYHALDSELSTVDVNPALGVRITDWLKVGFGAQIQYIDAKLSNAVDYGTIGAQLGTVPGGDDGRAKLTGDDWAMGYNAGALIEPVHGTRFGLAYRSEVEHHISGNASFSDDQAGVHQTSGLFRDTNAEVDVTTPAVASFGIHQDLGQRVALMAEAEWTQWSKFDELRVKFDDGQPDQVTDEHWHDTWFFALGATWRPLDTLTLRTGVAYDQSPTTDRYRTPRIPDGDRYWLSFGLDWQPRPWLGLDLGYSHVWVEDTKVDLEASNTGGVPDSINAHYDSSIDIVTAGLTLRF